MQVLIAKANTLADDAKKKIPDNDRKLGVGIVARDCSLYLNSVVVDSGCQFNVPSAGKYEEINMGFARTVEGVTGSFGVIHLTINGQPITLMWSLPFDYNLFQNWFGIAVGHNTFDDMYYK
jgi:hypothetical protein